MFDYDEIDDVEFENLLQQPSTYQPPQPLIWNWVARWFRRPQYHPVPVDDLFQVQEDAQLLSSEQVSRINSYHTITPPSASELGPDPLEYTFKPQMIVSHSGLDPLDVADTLDPVQEFDPELLAKLRQSKPS